MSKYPKRLKRSQAFVGLHFDFHANEKCTQVGKTVTLEMLQNMLKLTKPDYVQCDCKGHPGYASYPTKIGTAAPGFTQDPLKLWRQATAKQGISLYMHYSGVIDKIAVKKNPDWASYNVDGEPNENGSPSVFGPYVDELMIPMFKELAGDYQVDGVWVDGECWGVQMDYSTYALKAWAKATGKTQAPKSEDDPDWLEYRDFQRQGFREYLAHYLTEMHDAYPDFELASNWAYTGHMPEKVELDVDFISGDISLQNGFNRARLDSRIIEGQPKPWDLMSWSFNGSPKESEYSTKTAVQLNQEAAAILAMGGGFQAYFLQKSDGSICEWQMTLAQQTIQFCRERQAYCHRATPVPQVGLILSAESYYRQTDLLLSPWGGFYTAMEGNLRNLLDNQYAVQAPMTWELQEDINRYPLLVFAQWEHIEEDLKTRLINYVKDGGNLLIIGPSAVANFADELGITINGQPEKQMHYIAASPSSICGMKVNTLPITADAQTQVTHWLYPDNEALNPTTPAATLRKLGQGQIAGIYLDMGENYAKSQTCASRDFLGSIVKQSSTINCSLIFSGIISLVGLFTNRPSIAVGFQSIQSKLFALAAIDEVIASKDLD
ncbi:MAG: alpha-L-fucosidase, partial [Phycisphaeraceae bacterium]|nr:alpha-L-fucosidase [Phycisphaeraceae bacterium]